MTDPLNLNKVRKAKARLAKKQKADENAVKFGRTKAEREVEERNAGLAVTRLDQTKQDKP